MSNQANPDPCAPLILASFAQEEIGDLLALITGVRPDPATLSHAELATLLASTVARPGAMDVVRSLPLEGKLAELLVRLDSLRAPPEDLGDGGELTAVIPDDPELDTAPRLRDTEQATSPRLRGRDDATEPGIVPAPGRTDPGMEVIPVSAAPVEQPEITDVGGVVHDLSALDDGQPEPAPAQAPASTELELELPPEPPRSAATSSSARPPWRPSRMQLYLGLLVAELLLCVWACGGLVFGGGAPQPEQPPPTEPSSAGSDDLAATILAGTPSDEWVPISGVGGAPAGPLPLGGVTSAPRGGPSGRVHAALPDLLDMRFVELTAGEFTMGTLAEGEVGTDHERPAHRVRVQSFWLGVAEVSVAQWYALVDRPVPPSQDHRHAKAMVSWCEAVSFANMLSTLDNLPPFYADVESCSAKGTVRLSGREGGYRLPTEAEWEYAARAGRTEVPSRSSRCLDGRYSTTGTGNAWGFAGMNGVLWEWAWDAKYRYSAEPRADRVDASEGFEKVIRGGSFASPDTQCTVTARSATHLGDRTEDLGFRLAR